MVQVYKDNPRMKEVLPSYIEEDWRRYENGLKDLRTMTIQQAWSRHKSLENELKAMEIEDCWERQNLVGTFQRGYLLEEFDNLEDQELEYDIFACDQAIAAETLADFDNILAILNSKYSSRNNSQTRRMNLILHPKMEETFRYLTCDFTKPF